MREIKFRAWNGFKMYVPSLFNQNENGLFTETGSKGVFKGDSNKQILMQYTGLKDKNGKEIWEGDIVKVFVFCEQNEKQFIVKYGDREDILLNEGEEAVSLLTGFYLDGVKEIGDVSLYGKEHQIGIKIIGNIYENNNLIK